MLFTGSNVSMILTRRGYALFILSSILKFSTSEPLGAFVLLEALDVCLFVFLHVCLRSNFGFYNPRACAVL